MKFESYQDRKNKRLIMKRTLKRIVSLCLAVILMLSMSTSAFASTEDLCGDDAARVSYRYYYTTEKGEEHLLSTTTKTAAELAKESERNAWINVLAGVATGSYLGVGAAVTELVEQAHGYGTAAKIEVYSRTDVRYRVDSVTHKRTESTSTYYIIYKLYVKDGSSYKLYKTRECARHN